MKISGLKGVAKIGAALLWPSLASSFFVLDLGSAYVVWPGEPDRI